MLLAATKLFSLHLISRVNSFGMTKQAAIIRTVTLTSIWVVSSSCISFEINLSVLYHPYFVCLTLYRLGPWTWYRLETGVIRTSKNWTRDFWKKFFRKVTSGQITREKVYDFNAFLWEKFCAICFHVWNAIILRVRSS
jgi:hypothetical protein